MGISTGEQSVPFVQQRRSLLLLVCFLLTTIPGCHCSHSDRPDAEESCNDMRNTQDGRFQCTNANEHGSTCTFSCSRTGYELYPRGSRSSWTCNDGDWGASVMPACRDVQAPYLTCPTPLIKYTSRNNVNVTVSWNTPQVYDNSGSAIQAKRTSGSPSGSTFSEGRHDIKYNASDAAGNNATCSFYIIVRVNRCNGLITTNNQQMTCSNQQHQFIHGSRCSFSCDMGWCLDGSASMLCENTGTSYMPRYTWIGDQPTCNELRCPSLRPPLNGHFVGVCSNTYNSECEIGCDSGYELRNGKSTLKCVVVSDAESPCLGIWSGQYPQCNAVDREPPVFDGPNRLVIFAQARSYEAIVDYHWEPVKAEDSVSGEIDATLISIDSSPPIRPILLTEGTHLLVYEAVDENGNRASLTFELVVEVIRCDTRSYPTGFAMSCTHSNILGSSCVLNCPLGQCGSADSSMICENVGNSTHAVGEWRWDREQPHCRAIQCLPLQSPINSFFVNGHCANSYGDLCQMQCNNGFTLTSGNTIRRCWASPGASCNEGFWSGQHPQCADNVPPTFQPTPSITLLAESQTTFANLDYNWEPIIANDGASGEIEATLVRIDSQPISADSKPSTLNEGQHTLEYEAVDDAGNRNSFGLEIIVTVARCEMFNPDIYESVSCSHHNLHGSMCNFTCGIGQCLTGGNAVTCVSTGTEAVPQGEWNITLPTCQAVRCPDFTPPVAGYLVAETCVPTYGSMCEVQCNPGYLLLVTSNTIQCLAGDGAGCNDGYWTGSAICFDFEPPVFNVPPSFAVTFTAEPRQTTVSVQSYSWEPIHAYDSASGIIIADLIRIDSQPLPNGEKPSVFTEGTHSLEYEAVDESGNTAYLTIPLTVTVIRCSSQEMVTNGQIVCDRSDYLLGTACVLICSEGYCSEDANTLFTCAVGGGTEGEWGVSNPTCQQALCPNLPPPINGYVVSGASYCSQTLCEMACNRGYQATGDTVRYCRVDYWSCTTANWTGQPLQCHDDTITCPALREDFPAFHSGCNKSPNTVVPGTTCQWHCPPGYRGVGSDVSTCLTNGTWDIIDFICEEITCATLDAPPNTEFSPLSCGEQPSALGTFCLIECTKPGYELQTSSGDSHSLVRCDETGEWSAQHTNDSECIDTENPQFTGCLERQTLYAPKYFKMIYFYWNEAVDNSGIDPDVTCTQPEALLREGVYNVICTATDEANNQATCASEITVAVRRCQPTVPVLPNHGMLDSRYTCQNHYGGNCTIVCMDGYVQHGSSQVICEYDSDEGRASWSWTEQPSCQSSVNQCISLPEDLVTFGVNVHCTASNNIGSVCTFSCPLQGYVVIGVTQPLVCNADGSWNLDISTLNLRCHDKQPPSINQCPSGPIQGELSLDTSPPQAQVYFVIPQASDNSQQLPRYETTPTDVTSPYYFRNDTLVTYQFFDEAGNNATCSFQVTITNNLPPTIQECPEGLHFDATNDVAWQLPQFANPVTGEGIIPICNRQPGDDLSPGEHPITCTATNPDNGVNSVCSFVIAVAGCPSLPAPGNGDWSCVEDSCTVICNQGYDIRRGLPKVFTCGDNGWQPNESQVPTCKLTGPPLLRQTSDAFFDTNVDCNNEQTKQVFQNDFKGFIDQSAVGEPCFGMCNVTNIEVNCQNAEDLPQRRKRQPTVYVILACYTLEINMDTNVAEVNVTVTAEPNVTEEAQVLSELSDKVAEEIRSNRFNFSNIVTHPLYGDNGLPVKIRRMDAYCEAGKVLTSNGRCVACEAGTYESEGTCNYCPDGTQPSDDRTSCVTTEQ